MPEWARSIIKSIVPRLGLGRAFNSQDPTLEVNLLAYGFGVLVMAFLLTWWTIKGQRDGNLVAALAVFAGAITGGLFKKESNAPQQTTGAGAPGKDGEA